MTSQDQFEAWAEIDMPELRLQRSDLTGHFVSPATWNFFKVWSARDGEIAQLKATVANYEMGLEAAKEEIAQLKGDNADGLAVLRTQAEQLECYILDAERYRYMRKCSCEFRSGLPNHDPVLETDFDAECDAAMSKGEQP